MHVSPKILPKVLPWAGNKLFRILRQNHEGESHHKKSQQKRQTAFKYCLIEKRVQDALNANERYTGLNAGHKTNSGMGIESKQ